jgi:phosphoribosyl 1,2-cyclic phosphate phosphodiesterase
MKITFLGTGTSQGVPLVNCNCSVCLSDNPKNKRLRTSVSIQSDETTLLIDTTPDLRQQLLKYPIARLTAVLYTHAHADHIYGIDDLRRFNILQKERIPVFADSNTMSRLRHVFDYAFGNGELKYGLPNLEANYIDGHIKINDLEISPIELFHGEQPVLGFRIGDIAYCTDVSSIPSHSYSKLNSLKILILDALRDRRHPTHFSLAEAVQEARKIGAQKTYFVHMSHDIDHDVHEKALPDNIKFAYDGLILEL